MEKAAIPLADLSAYNVRELARQLEVCQSRILIGRNSAFYGSLLCGLDFFWTTGIPTAATNGEFYCWNPDWFLSLPPETRPTILLHEIWHVARMHIPRMGERNPLGWNWATDTFINNHLLEDGYSFDGVKSFWKDRDMMGRTEEEIYAIYEQQGIIPDGGPWGMGGSDMMEPTTKDGGLKNANKIVRAMHTANLVGDPGSIPGDTLDIINTFLAPEVHWEEYIHKYLTLKQAKKTSWRRPSRRHQTIYMPTRIPNKGALDKMVFFIDTSGSISQDQIRRIVSEIHHIKIVYKPKELTLVFFDTIIQKTTVIEETDTFEEVEIVGGGGTCLKCVRVWIQTYEPTVAIIMSDMWVEPMEQPTTDTDILWVVLDNLKLAPPPYGDMTHVDTTTITHKKGKSHYI